ncbi:unnamed protein product, partial [marine sediment metagenome]
FNIRSLFKSLTRRDASQRANRVDQNDDQT